VTAEDPLTLPPPLLRMDPRPRFTHLPVMGPACVPQGETKMAITGCLAAPIFNVLGGFGGA
jgi:hypothetical protein